MIEGLEEYRGVIDATVNLVREAAKLTATEVDDQIVATIENLLAMFLGPRVYGAAGEEVTVAVPAGVAGAWWLPIVLAAVQAILARIRPA